jgi:hypothetical protein
LIYTQVGFFQGCRKQPVHRNWERDFSTDDFSSFDDCFECPKTCIREHPLYRFPMWILNYLNNVLVVTFVKVILYFYSSFYSIKNAFLLNHKSLFQNLKIPKIFFMFLHCLRF